MNQNGNSIGGEENRTDGYLGEFSVHLTPTDRFPYEQSFENDAILDLDGWAFASRGPGEWEIESSDDVHDGSLQLRGRQTADGFVSQSAVLSLNLADQADVDRLSLSFWASTNNRHRQMGRLFISDDGERWNYVTHIASDRDPVSHAIDLKSTMLERGIEFDNDVRLRFEYQSSSRGSDFTLDAVKVNYDDVKGPRIVSQSGLKELDNERRSITVRFDRPIDASTFTSQDIDFSMSRNRVNIEEIVAVDDRSFSIIFETSAAGFYDLQVGPNISGANGIPMNQIDDAFNGSDSDQYTSTVFIPLEPETVPYFESFSDSRLTALEGWLFSGNRWRTTTQYDPEDDRHISATKSGDCWEDFVGTVALDITPYVGRTDLVLEF